MLTQRSQRSVNVINSLYKLIYYKAHSQWLYFSFYLDLKGSIRRNYPPLLGEMSNRVPFLKVLHLIISTVCMFCSKHCSIISPGVRNVFAFRSLIESKEQVYSVNVCFCAVQRLSQQSIAVSDRS